VSVYYSIEFPNTLHFAVSDSGIGIKPEDQRRLFRMFSRSQDAISKQNNTRGVGLGLTISKRLVEQFGGEIWIESVFERGTTVNFTIQIQLSDDLPLTEGMQNDVPSMRFQRNNLLDTSQLASS